MKRTLKAFVAKRHSSWQFCAPGLTYAYSVNDVPMIGRVAMVGPPHTVLAMALDKLSCEEAMATLSQVAASYPKLIEMVETLDQQSRAASELPKQFLMQIETSLSVEAEQIGYNCWMIEKVVAVVTLAGIDQSFSAAISWHDLPASVATMRGLLQQSVRAMEVKK